MRKYFRIILAGFVVVLLSALFACGSPAGTTTSTTPLPTGPQSKDLVNGDISVGAEIRNNYAFNVTADMKDVSVVGSFKTIGGVPNTIEAYLMDDTTYKNWIGGRTVHILFDSGSLSSGNIDQAITVPGLYHIVFANYYTASVAPEQIVTTNIQLKWNY